MSAAQLLATGLLAAATLPTGKVVDLVEVHLSSHGDDIAFDRGTLHATTAHPLRLTFTNQASPGSDIFHNVVVARPGAGDALLQQLSEGSYDLGFLMGDARVIGMTRPLHPGESQTLTLSFDQEGAYPFICMMPGHGDLMGMRGVIEVGGEP